MKADLQISIKDFRRGKALRIQFSRTPFGPQAGSEQAFSTVFC
jgi:hypothetical protein